MLAHCVIFVDNSLLRRLHRSVVREYTPAVQEVLGGASLCLVLFQNVLFHPLKVQLKTQPIMKASSLSKIYQQLLHQAMASPENCMAENVFLSVLHFFNCITCLIYLCILPESKDFTAVKFCKCCIFVDVM